MEILSKEDKEMYKIVKQEIEKWKQNKKRTLADLSEQAREFIAKLYLAYGLSTHSIARIFGISPASVSRIAQEYKSMYEKDEKEDKDETKSKTSRTTYRGAYGIARLIEERETPLFVLKWALGDELLKPENYARLGLREDTKVLDINDAIAKGRKIASEIIEKLELLTESNLLYQLEICKKFSNSLIMKVRNLHIILRAVLDKIYELKEMIEEGAELSADDVIREILKAISDVVNRKPEHTTTQA